jgi:hypothetical protein
MWEKLTPADIERAKQVLADRRRELEAELSGLDEKWRNIGILQQLIDAFVREHMSSAASSVQPTNTETRQAPMLVALGDL